MRHVCFIFFSHSYQQERDTKMILFLVIRSVLVAACLIPYTGTTNALLLSVPISSSRNRRIHTGSSTSSSTTITIDRRTQKMWSSYYYSAEEDRTKQLQQQADLMNRYNFDTLESIAAEWTAVVKAGSSLQPAGIFVEPRDTKTNFADIVTVRFPRPQTGGLGLELLELAGGREDGRGITVIETVVPGGPMDGVGLLPGDTLVDITVESTTTSTTTGTNTSIRQAAESAVSVDSVELECLCFDATVAAIRSLPPPRGAATAAATHQETMIVSVKRLRRRPKVKVNLQYPSDNNDNNTDEKKTETLELFCGENLRRALLVRGVKLNDPLARRFDSGGSGDCGADGTCATCAVAVVRGADLLTPPTTMERQLFSGRSQESTWRMSCKTKIGMTEGELTIRVNPRQW
jgi:ferredoxin